MDVDVLLAQNKRALRNIARGASPDALPRSPLPVRIIRLGSDLCGKLAVSCMGMYGKLAVICVGNSQ